MVLVISHQMESVIGFDPLIDGVNFPPQNGTVQIARNEYVHIRIERDQKAVKSRIQIVKQFRFDGQIIDPNLLNNVGHTAQIDVIELARNATKMAVRVAISVNVVVNADQPIVIVAVFNRLGNVI